MASFWGQKTFCIVAGASRGIGRAISVTFAKKVGPGSVILLLARSTDALEITRSAIAREPENKCAHIFATPLDLSNPDQSVFHNTLADAFAQSGTSPSDFNHCILVQCAASLGIDRGLKVQQIQDVDYIKKYYDFNLASFVLLNSVFCETVVGKGDEGKQAAIIHISSHAAVHPFKTWGLYCSARAAKDMLLRSIALESPNIQTLNYVPGLVDTENYNEALKYTADPELLKYLEEERAKGKLITPQQTATKLADVLATKAFVKGERVAYED